MKNTLNPWLGLACALCVTSCGEARTCDDLLACPGRAVSRDEGPASDADASGTSNPPWDAADAFAPASDAATSVVPETHDAEPDGGTAPEGSPTLDSSVTLDSGATLDSGVTLDGGLGSEPTADAQVEAGALPTDPCDVGQYRNGSQCLNCSSCGWLSEESSCTLESDTVCSNTDVTVQFGTEEAEFATALALDPAGNVWVAGHASGPLFAENDNLEDVYLRSYPADGSAPRIFEFGSQEDDRPSALAVDAAGNVWVAGWTDGDLSGDNLGGRDAFVRRYPADESTPATFQFGTEEFDVASAVAADAAGNIWVAGETGGALSGDNLGLTDAFIRQYPADGSTPVTFQFGTEAFDIASAVATDAAGNVWVAGSTNGNLSGVNLGESDAFLRRYPADGSAPQTFQFGSEAPDFATAVAVDSSGNVWVAGGTQGDLNGDNSGSNDVFVRQYPADGGAPKTFQFGTAATDSVNALALDAQGNVYLAGSTSGALGGANLGEQDAFLRVYPAEGGAPKTFQFGSEQTDAANALAVDASGNLWVAGFTYGNLSGDNFGFGDSFVRQLVH